MIVFDVTIEGWAIHLTVVNGAGLFDDAIESDGTGQGGCFPMAVRCLIIATLVFWSTSITTCHVALGSRFVEESEAYRISETAGDSIVLSLRNDVRPKLFRGDQRLAQTDVHLLQRSTQPRPKHVVVNPSNKPFVMPPCKFE